jgi:hypothetical protein
MVLHLSYRTFHTSGVRLGVRLESMATPCSVKA